MANLRKDTDKKTGEKKKAEVSVKRYAAEVVITKAAEVAAQAVTKNPGKVWDGVKKSGEWAKRKSVEFAKDFPDSKVGKKSKELRENSAARLHRGNRKRRERSKRSWWVEYRVPIAILVIIVVISLLLEIS